MKILCLALLILSVDFSLEWFTEEEYDQLLKASLTTVRPRTTATTEKTNRISAQKCEFYKDLVAVISTSGSLCLGNCKPRIKKSYNCIASTGLIIGGQKTRAKEFPHMAAIGWKSSQGQVEFKCGGSLISELFVLTVAHCGIEFQDPSIVRLGDQNLATNDDGAQPVEYKIETFIKHQQYHHRNKENDIALIKLDKVVIFNSFIRPACLYSEAEFSGTVIATGWGQTKYRSSTSNELLKVQLELVDRNTCIERNDMDAKDLFESQMCAGGRKNADTCQGDSGGPIQVAHRDAQCVYNIVGITSYGSFHCGTSLPSIYTKVYPYIDWIEQTVWS